MRFGPWAGLPFGECAAMQHCLRSPSQARSSARHSTCLQSGNPLTSCAPSLRTYTYTHTHTSHAPAAAATNTTTEPTGPAAVARARCGHAGARGKCRWRG